MPAFVEADSYTTIDRVEALVARGVLSGTTVPTSQHALDRMALRGAEVSARINSLGFAATPPSGGSPISEATAAGKTLKNLADSANAHLAAGDVLFMHDIKSADTDPPGVQALWDEGYKQLDALEGFVVSGALGSATSSARTSTTTGGIAAAQFNESGFEAEPPRSKGFGVNTRW